MTTVDLELEIGRNTGGGYPVFARTGGEVATTCLPVAVGELDRRLPVVRSAVLASSELHPAAGEDEQHVRELGRQLFEALVVDGVRDLYAAGRRVQEQGGTMRLVLRVRPVELARLPWELMFDPDRQDYLSMGLSLVRYPEVLAPRQPLQLTTPLRILGMVVCARDEDAPGIDDERRRLDAALAGWERDGLVEPGWVTGQTPADLRDALDRGPWHALHIVDHEGDGRVDDKRTPALIQNAGRAPLLGSDAVSKLLADHDTLRLVVLNSGGAEAGDVVDGFPGIAGTLLRRGIPAVVAMQFGMTDPAAVRFTQTLYHGVATCLPVDTAVLRARRALRLAKKDTLEWGSPVLYLRASGGRIFTAATPLPGPGAGQAGPPEPDTRYAEALDAFWAQRWDQAIELLREVFAHRPDHPDAADKLAQACHEQHLVIRYAQACTAVDAGDWEQAVAGFAMVADADPLDLDVRDRLEDARRQHSAALLAQASRDDPGSVAPPAGSPRLVLYVKAEQIMHARKGVNAVAFSPDGSRLATAGSKNTAQIWDTTNGQELLTVGSRAWRHSMEAVAFGPDGSRLATASHDGTARIWDTASGEELLKVTHGGQVWGVAFRPDGSWLATASDDGTARIWDTAGGYEVTKVTHDNWVRAVAFSPDGWWLATAGVDQTARIWDAASGRELAVITHDSLVSGVAFSPDGGRLATAGQDGTARIWDATDGQELARVSYDSPVLGVAFSPDGRWLATAGQDRTARIWDLTGGQELATVIHADQVWGVAFSPDGRYLATASADKTARIWALELEEIAPENPDPKVAVPKESDADESVPDDEPAFPHPPGDD